MAKKRHHASKRHHMSHPMERHAARQDMHRMYDRADAMDRSMDRGNDSHSREMHRLYTEADAIDRGLDSYELPYVARDRRDHAKGEHYGLYGRPSHENPRGEHTPDGPRGYEPRANNNGENFEARMDLNHKMRIMQTNNGNMGPIREDFNRPCGVPYGAISRDLGNGAYYSMNAFRVGDLYEQVDETMRQDADAIKSMTKPTNW